MLSIEEITGLQVAKEQAERDAEKARSDLKVREEILRKEMNAKLEALRAEIQEREEAHHREMSEVRAQLASVQEALREATGKQPAADSTVGQAQQQKSNNEQQPQQKTPIHIPKAVCDDPEMQKSIQQQLMLFLHAQRCQRQYMSALERGEQHHCHTPYCHLMKNVLRHLIECGAGKDCTVPHCTSTRQIAGHWRNCKHEDCPVCLPVRESEKQYQVNQGGQEAMDTANQSSVITAAADSQSHLSNAGEPDPDIDEPSAALAIIVDLQKRHFGVVELEEAEKPENEDNRSESSHAADSFEAEDITALPSRIQKSWHRTVPLHLRRHLIKQLVHTIVPPTQIPSILDRRIYNMVLYSQKIEGNIYEAANSKTEYYHLLAEKIYKIHVELTEKRRKHREEKELIELQVQQAEQNTASSSRVSPSADGQSPQPQPQPQPQQRRDYIEERKRLHIESLVNQHHQLRQQQQQEEQQQQEQEEEQEEQGQMEVLPIDSLVNQPEPGQPIHLQADSLLSPEQRNQLQDWYMQQRLIMFQRMQQANSTQPISGTSG